jgi:hypothetical protein
MNCPWKKSSLLITAAILLALSACAGTASVTSSPVASTVPPTEQFIPQDISPAAETGLVLLGTVTIDGRPLEGVNIYRSFASYAGEVVTVTGKDGTYRSKFMFIPGDEMVTVWAELEGYTFTPENVNWRHYYGYEERTVDFSASSSKRIP